MPAPKGPKPTPKPTPAKAQRPKLSSGKGKSPNDNAAGDKFDHLLALVESRPPAKKRSNPKVEAGGNGMDLDMDRDMASNDAKPGGAAKPRARKSDGQGGGSKKRPKKQVGDEARYGGIGALLDDDEDSADRRAVENLIEAARGNTRPLAPPDNGGRKANGGKRADKAAAASSHGVGGDWESGSAGLGVGAAGLYGGVAASLLGSLGLANLQLPQLQQLQQLHEYHELRKRMEQQVYLCFVCVRARASARRRQACLVCFE